MITRAFLRDLLERTASTYLEAFIGFLILAPSLDSGRLVIVLVAALPAGFSAMKALLLQALGVTGKPGNLWLDLVERTVTTYLVTFLGLVAVNPGSVAVYRLAAVSSLPAALAVVKGTLASRITGLPTASIFPEIPPAPAVAPAPESPPTPPSPPVTHP